MIKVLQKRAFEKPTDIENILSIPIHDPVSLNLHAKQVCFKERDLKQERSGDVFVYNATIVANEHKQVKKFEHMVIGCVLDR